MWGWCGKLTAQQINATLPPKPIPGHEGKCRWQLLHPTEDMAKIMRRLHPFLQLAMAKIPGELTKSDYEARAEPCLNLGWDTTRKAYALYTIPNLKVKYSVQVAHISGVFPLRVTNHLNKQIYKFLQPEGSDFERLSGPAEMLRRHAAQVPAQGERMLIEGTPTQVRQDASTGRAGPPRVSGRDWTPSTQALQNIASANSVQGVRLTSSRQAASGTISERVGVGSAGIRRRVRLQAGADVYK